MSQFVLECEYPNCNIRCRGGYVTCSKHRYYNPDRVTKEAIFAEWFRLYKPDPTTGCIIPHDIASDSRGYRFKQNPWTDKQDYVHRISWRFFNNNQLIPFGKHVLHSCPGGGTPGCMNPKHLRLGTPKENSADLLAANRHKRAKRGKQLPESRVKAIMTDLLSGKSGYATAKAHGVPQTTVSDIRRNRIHTRITVPGWVQPSPPRPPRGRPPKKPALSAGSNLRRRRIGNV